MQRFLTKESPIKIVGKRFVPLFCIDGGDKVLCFERGRFFLLDAKTLNKEYVSLINIDKKRYYASMFPILTRRYGINEIKSIKINNDFALIIYHYKYYILNLRNWIIKELKRGESRGSVLSLTKTSKGVMFGDYGYNPQKEEMGIFILKDNPFSVEQVYRFAPGEVNHIHKIVEDENSGRFWVLTGDFDNSAAIYYTDDFFKSLHKAVGGSQQYRSCNAITYNNGLVYLTDTPLEENHIIELNNFTANWITTINGSCIYSVLIGDNIIYSTTVENQTDEMNNGRNAYKYNLGNGIKDWYVELNSYNVKTHEQKNIIRIKKDLLPMIPFQYGCFRFASGNDGEYLYFYGQAVKKYDQVVMRIKKDYLT